MPMSVLMVVVGVYLLLGVEMYHYYEDWNTLDCIYAIFITTSTIGLGDYQPAYPAPQRLSLYFALHVVYMTVGLCVFSATVHAVQEIEEIAAIRTDKAVGAAARARSNSGNSTRLSNVDTPTPVTSTAITYAL
jgi:hypothetical protein